jgi:hypothetical protein
MEKPWRAEACRPENHDDFINFPPSCHAVAACQPAAIGAGAAAAPAPHCGWEDSSGRRKEHQMKFRFLSRLVPRAPSEAEREMAYLNGATSLVDLEYRQREIDRRKIRNKFY